MGFGCNCKNIIKSICNSGTSTEFTKEDIGIMASRGVTLRIHERHVSMLSFIMTCYSIIMIFSWLYNRNESENI
ncbi:hypothetical protein Leryth_014780, partial [Lithospermum erythrorhizon]